MEDALLSWPGMVVLWTAMPGHFAFHAAFDACICGISRYRDPCEEK
jgi:hypothetical protein